MRPNRALMCAAACVVFFTGCGATPSSPQRLYQLSATPGSVVAVPANAVRIGVGPILWPEYLDRRSLLIRVDSNTLRASEADRWAEPLDLNFTRVLREDLAKLSGSAQFVIYPWNAANPPERTIRLEVLQFDSDAGGVATLRTRWSISNPSDVHAPLENVGEWRIQAKDSSIAATVAAQSEALAALAKQIAAALKAA